MLENDDGNAWPGGAIALLEVCKECDCILECYKILS